jgi:hypothetical protein
MQTGAVVDRGVYAITRHPQYLGYMLLACGFALLSQHWLAILLAAVCVTCFYLQAVSEEEYCLAQLGSAYERYLQLFSVLESRPTENLRGEAHRAIKRKTGTQAGLRVDLHHFGGDIRMPPRDLERTPCRHPCWATLGG